MSNPQVNLAPLEHRERLMLKQRLQIERTERTPTASAMQLTDHDDLLMWDPTNANQFFLAILAAEYNNAAIGTIWGIIFPESGYARLMDIYLVDDERFTGLGTEVIEAVEEYLAKEQCFEMRLEIHDHSPLTVAILERLGYRTLNIRMGKKLRRPISPHIRPELEDG